MNQTYNKKGVFTSYANRTDTNNPTKKENIIINEGNQPHQYKQYLQIPPNRTNLSVEQLNGAKFVQSTGYSVQRPELQFRYVNGSQSTFVPPPPQRFLVNSGQSYSQPSQLPINSTGQVQTFHAVQPLYQSIKRTFVPHHIYNQIPVMNSQTKQYYEVNNEVSQQEEIGVNEADQQLMEQYEKIYEAYHQKCMKVEELQRQLKEQRERRQSNPSEVKEMITTKEVFIEKPKKVDIKLLASLIIKKNKITIDQLVERKKTSCINKLRALFSEEQSALKTTLYRSSEEFTSTKVRIR